ncbi:MAG: hypothetical protein JF606_28505 [Burkholderiales bacterium]|jgi:hypothetical protein|nr:hypothetical protein [Burkholderiales bacterium]
MAAMLMRGAQDVTLPKIVAKATSAASRPVPKRTKPNGMAVSDGLDMHHRLDVGVEVGGAESRVGLRWTARVPRDRLLWGHSNAENNAVTRCRAKTIIRRELA